MSPPYNSHDPDSARGIRIDDITPRAWEYNSCPKCYYQCVGLYLGQSAKYAYYYGKCRHCGMLFRFTASGTVHDASALGYDPDVDPPRSNRLVPATEDEAHEEQEVTP